MHQLFHDRDFLTMLVLIAIISAVIIANNLFFQRRQLYVSAIEAERSMPTFVEQIKEVYEVMDSAWTIDGIEKARHIIRIFEMDNSDVIGISEDLGQWRDELDRREGEIVRERYYGGKV